jgi:hypothetical protein
MKNLLVLTAIIAAVGFAACKSSGGMQAEKEDAMGQDDYTAYFVEIPPVIDGAGDDEAWKRAEWKEIKYPWLINPPYSPPSGPEDFSGKYKVVWTEDRLYILVEIIDDIISVTRAATPYVNPENDDCLEVFINENGKGGTRSGTASFFAYHMSFGGVNVADYVGSPDVNSADITKRIQNGFILRNSHLNYAVGKPGGNTYIWEIEMKVYNDTYPLRSNPDDPSKLVKLTEGKTMGFAIAYNDADSKNTREHFIGSMSVTGKTDEQRNKAYRDATEYARLILAKN